MIAVVKHYCCTVGGWMEKELREGRRREGRSDASPLRVNGQSDGTKTQAFDLYLHLYLWCRNGLQARKGGEREGKSQVF